MRTVVQEMRMRCTVYLSYFDQRQVIVDKKSIFQSPIYSIAKGLTHGFGRGDSEDFLAKPLGKKCDFWNFERWNFLSPSSSLFYLESYVSFLSRIF